MNITQPTPPFPPFPGGEQQRHPNGASVPQSMTTPPFPGGEQRDPNGASAPQPMMQQRFAQAPGYVPPPAGTVRPRRFSNEQVVAMLLATAGVVVTLVGVVLLLVMAAHEGMLTPPVRVAGGALGAAALAGAAAWVRPRTGGRIGSVALLATGAAAAYFDVIAVTRIYSWVALGVGLALALVVAAATAWLAMRWDEKWLFLGVTLAATLCAPSLTSGPGLALTAFLFLVQVIGVGPELLRRWDEVSLARTAPVVLAAASWVSIDDSTWVPVMAGLVALVGVATIVLAASVRPEALWAPIAFVSAWLPLWVFTIRADRMTWALLASAATLVAAAVWWAVRDAGRAIRVGVLTAFVINALILAAALATGSWIAVPVLVVALVLFAAQAICGQRVVGQLAVAVLTLAVLTQHVATPMSDLFYRGRAAELPVSVVVSGAVMLAICAVAMWSVTGRGFAATHVQMTLVAAGSVGLIGLAMVMVASLGRTATGFFLVHLVITVVALAVAAAVLVAGLRRPRHLAASMWWGLALVGCALLKLLVFDLHYMGAATKAMTCVVGGLVLLVAGTAYARTYPDAMRTARQERPADVTDEAGRPEAFVQAPRHDGQQGDMPQAMMQPGMTVPPQSAPSTDGLAGPQNIG